MSAERQRLALRARQIKALYQRELTALHRDPAVGPDERPERETALWRQTTAKLAELREEAEQSGALAEQERAAFDAPQLPHPPPLSPARERGDG